jgi:hypothetical protein
MMKKTTRISQTHLQYQIYEIDDEAKKRISQTHLWN